MASEHPPEEAELQRPVGYTCLHCDGWGCKRCLVLAGEQGLDVDELREIRLLGRVRELEADAQEYEREHLVYRRALERIVTHCSYVREQYDPLAIVGGIAVDALKAGAAP